MALKVCQLCAVDFTLKHFLLPLIDRMEKKGWIVISVCSDGPNIAELSASGYKIKPVYIERSFNLFQHFKSVLVLTRYFKQQQFDIVHVHSPIAALIARIAAYLASVPTVIYTAHGFYFHDEMPRLKRMVFLWLEKWAGQFTDILFTQSLEDAEVAKLEKLVPKNAIYAIGNGVDPGKFNPQKFGNGAKIRKSLGIPDNAFVIGMIARLVQEKGICEFLEAATQAAVENDKIYFLVIGTRLDSDHAQEVSNTISAVKEKLANRLMFLGQRKDVPELISTMDVFCLPSWREGMPRSIIEAMMMGKAVIATNIRGSREEVIEGKTGYLVPTRNSKLLKEKFLYCATHREEMKKMGEAGRERALNHFDEHKIIEKQITIIQSHIADKKKHEAFI